MRRQLYVPPALPKDRGDDRLQLNVPPALPKGRGDGSGIKGSSGHGSSQRGSGLASLADTGSRAPGPRAKQCRTWRERCVCVCKSSSA